MRIVKLSLALAIVALAAYLARSRRPAPPIVRERQLASANGSSPQGVRPAAWQRAWRDPYPDRLLEPDEDWLRRRLEGWL